MRDSRVSPLLNRLGGLYRDPARVDRDASIILKSSVGRNLAPQICSLVENNGNSSNTLCLQGTIAFHYKGNTYQQLVDIYLPAGYPVRAPTCFVRLAPNMYLKEKHPHVGADGQVFLPYLHEWKPHSHTLVELVINMSSVFSADPPCFQRAPPPPIPPTPPPTYEAYTTTAATTTAAYTSSANVMVSADAEAILAREAEEANRAAEAARRADQEELEQEKQRKAQEEWDAKNLAATKEKLRRKVFVHLQEQSRETKSLLENDLQDQKRLEHSRLEKDIKLLQVTKKELEKQIGVVDQATSEIQEWLRDARSQAESQEQKSVDEMVTPVSPVHAQVLQLSVENHALTDAMYFLDNALHKKTIDVTTHLRQVRALSKKQFLSRAHLNKITQTLAG